MAKFTYEVQDMNGKKLRGSVEADSREKVVFALQNKGYIVVDVKEGGGASLFGGASGPKKRVKCPGTFWLSLPNSFPPLLPAVCRWCGLFPCWGNTLLTPCWVPCLRK